MDLQQVVGWLRRLARFDTRVFDEVRSNPSATTSGVVIAAVSILLSGIGGWLWWMFEDFGGGSDIFIHSAILGSAIAIVLWGLAWVGVVYLILTQVFHERAYLEQLLRVMGLAAAPLALTLLMCIPPISFGVALTALVLAFGLTNAAIQSVTTANPGRVLVANAGGFLLWACLLSLLATPGSDAIRPHAPGIFLYNATLDALHNALTLGS